MSLQTIRMHKILHVWKSELTGLRTFIKYDGN